MTYKITLINPPQVFTKSQSASSVIPPLGIMYLASYLLKHDYAVQIIDALGEAPTNVISFKKKALLKGLSFEEIIQRIDFDTKLIGISNLFSFSYPALEILCKKIHQIHPDKKIILGGPHPSALYSEILLRCPEVDYVAIGEGEETLLRLVKFLDKKADSKSLTGLAMRDSKGKIKVLKPTERLKNLDQKFVPYPARHLIPMENYIKTKEGHGPTFGRWTVMMSSRGCIYGCAFCKSRQSGWVGRSAKDVVDEMEYCIKTWGITDFHFEDDNMTIDKKRVMGICDEIIKRKLNIRWQTPNGIRASRTDKEMLLKMKKSGCFHITLAPESGSERVLKEIIKKGADFSLKQLEKCAQDAHKIGFKIAAYFVLGLPGEKIEDIEMTIKYSYKLAKTGVDDAYFGLFIPLPGTPLWDKVSKKRKKLDWFDLLAVGDMTRAVSWSEFVSDEQLHKLRLKAYLGFQLRRNFFHPMAFLRTIKNVLLNKEETKTEKTLHQYIKRILPNI